MKKNLQKISLIFQNSYDITTEEGREKERIRRIVLTALTAMIAKVLAMLIPIVTIRITLKYMGNEIYGLWTTVLSFFTMFSFADLGLGSGLQTEMSKATATGSNNLNKKMVSSCYVILSVVSICLLIIFFILYPNVNWGKLVNAMSIEATCISGGIVMIVVTSKIINIPVSLIQRTQLAMQEGYRSNLWICIANIFSVLCVIIVYKLNFGIYMMIFTSSYIMVIVSIFNMIFYFKKQRPEICPELKFFDKKITYKLLKTGVMFFILSILISFSLSVDNFIVAKTCGLKEVTSYSLLYKIVSIIGMIMSMLSTPMWAANGEAIERREYNWVRHTTFKIVIISLGFALISSIGIIIFIKPILWIIVDNMIDYNIKLLVGMCLFQISLSITSPFFMILNGAGIIKFQIIEYFIFSIVSVPLKYIVGLKYGAIGIIWVGTFTYIIFLTIPTIIISLKVLSGKKELCK